jgi:GNAT superfamily N-acetyltransferase
MSEAANWIPDKYQSADLPGLAELAQRNLGDVDFAQAEFAAWQYERNPAGKPVLEMARDAADRGIVGQYVVIPIRVQVGEQAVVATLSLNTLTDEKFRGKGIFTKLAERVYADCAQRSLPFTYGFPNTNSYPGFLKKLRFKDLGNVPLLLLPLNWRRVATVKTNAAVGFLAGVAGGIYMPLSRMFRGSAAPGITVKAIEGFDARWDAFWARNQRRFPVMVVRDRAYLNWRFVDIPIRKYRILAAEGSEGPLGYMALRTTESFGLRAGFIIDFFVDGSPAGQAAGALLARRALEEFKRDGADLAATHSLPHSAEYRLLQAAGLKKCPERLLPRPTPVIVRGHLDGFREDSLIYDLRSWYLTLGDYDAV